MKIIFLDIDGVLNVIPETWDSYGPIFHKPFENNLQELIDTTGAKIVISASMRTFGLEYLQQMWRDRKLPGEIYSVTPNLEMIRGVEIEDWLKYHSEVENYVIIDDDSDMLISQKDKLVLCSGNNHHPDCIDDGYGFTKQCMEQAIAVLNSMPIRN